MSEFDLEHTRPIYLNSLTELKNKKRSDKEILAKINELEDLINAVIDESTVKILMIEKQVLMWVMGLNE